MGLFELRNLVEAVILTVPALYLCIAFLPFGLTAKIIVTLVVVVPVGGFGLNDISFNYQKEGSVTDCKRINSIC